MGMNHNTGAYRREWRENQEERENHTKRVTSHMGMSHVTNLTWE